MLHDNKISVWYPVNVVNLDRWRTPIAEGERQILTVPIMLYHIISPNFGYTTPPYLTSTQHQLHQPSKSSICFAKNRCPTKERHASVGA